MEVGLEKGFRTTLGEFVIMQLQLASVFFVFQLGQQNPILWENNTPW
jgi:callose synthase